MSSLIKEFSQKHDIKHNFLGSYVILPGQFTLLDNQVINVSKDHLKIIINGTNTQIFDYSVNDIILRHYEGEALYAVEIRLDNINKFNVKDPDEIDNLLNKYLYLQTPTIVYLTYDANLDIFALKNMNMATLFVLQKVQ